MAANSREPQHPMRNPLQEQLLKAGLVKKNKLTEVVREQNRKRHGKGEQSDDAARVEAARLQAEKAERDRALAAERNAEARANELRAQVRQIIDANRQKRDGEIAYRFEAGGMIRSLLVDAAQRAALARGALVIVRDGDDYVLLPRAAGEKVAARDPTLVVLDHGRSNEASPADSDEDEAYRRFPVPDDLIW